MDRPTNSRVKTLFFFLPLSESGAVSGLFTEALPGSGDFALPVVPPPLHYSNLFASGQPGSRTGRFPSLCAANPQRCVSGGKVFLFCKTVCPANRLPEPKHLPLNGTSPFLTAHGSLFVAFSPSVCESMLHFSRWLHFDSVAARARGLPVCCLCACACPGCGGVM